MKKFGKYLLERQLAIGGMAEVFLARQHGPAGFEKTLVIKKILPHFANDEDFITMFLDEARTSAKLNHPNLVQIYELGEIEGAYYIAMEYIRGESLNKVIRKLKKVGFHIPLHLAAKIISSVCAGLDYAHSFAGEDGVPLNLVHRDISPDNVLVSFDGAVKMIDFGIAKARSSEHQTQAGAVKGKFCYMSPEQVTGKTLDKRSDIFSLGIVLHELTTLNKPFGEGADLMTITAIVNDPPKKAMDLVDGYPEGLWGIISKALNKHREDRFETTHEMQIALERFIHSRGEFLSDRDIGDYMKKLFSDKMEDIEELRGMASGIQSRVLVPAADGDAGINDAATLIRESPSDTSEEAYQPTEISQPLADLPPDDATVVADAPPGPTVAMEPPEIDTPKKAPRTDIVAPPPSSADNEPSGAKTGGGAVKAIIALLVVAGLGVGGWFAYQNMATKPAAKDDSGSTTEVADATTGGETTGSETTGSETTGSETTGSETTGSETPGSETTGADTPDAGAAPPEEDATTTGQEVADAGQVVAESPDAGSEPVAEDAGPAPPEDAGPAALEDAGAPPAPEDAGAPPTVEDAGAPPAAEDAGAVAVPEDTGAPPVAEDAGTPPAPEDAGAPPVEDAGPTAEADAGAPEKPDAVPAVVTPKTGTLTVTASQRLKVTIDGKRAGRTPLTRALPAGSYVVRAAGGGYSTKWTVTIAAGATEKRHATVPIKKKGTITFRVPAGTIVKLDGKTLGKAPVGKRNVTYGKHRVVLINPKDSSQRVTRTVRISATRLHVTVAF